LENHVHQSKFAGRSADLQTDGNPGVCDQHAKKMLKSGKLTLEFEVILSLFSILMFVVNNVELLAHDNRLERVTRQILGKLKESFTLH